MKKPPWSMTLLFQRMLYWSMFRLLKRNTIRIRNMEVLPQVLTLCVKEIMILMIVIHFHILTYKKDVSGCFITNCVMVVLVQFLSIIMLGIARTERNAKFVNKVTQLLCMVIKQRKVKLRSKMVTLQNNQK